jgi:hypothetical protein
VEKSTLPLLKSKGIEGYCSASDEDDEVPNTEVFNMLLNSKNSINIYQYQNSGSNSGEANSKMGKAISKHGEQLSLGGASRKSSRFQHIFDKLDH